MYEYYHMKKLSPTIGMYFFADEFIKFIHNIKHYTSLPLEIVSANQSKYFSVLCEKHQDKCLIGKLDDIEIVLLHYKDASLAKSKWERRCKRINFDNIIYKMSEMNLCSEQHLRSFDSFEATRKILFVSKDYGLHSQIVLPEWEVYGEVKNDTTNFMNGFSLRKLINSSYYP